MSYSSLINKTSVPDDKIVFKILGSVKDAWKDISDYLIIEKKAKSAYKFYGNNYGWALGFSKNGKSIISLYPDKEDFYIQIILNERQERLVLENIKNKKIERLISEKSRIREEKWIFIKFSELKSIKDIRKMIDIRIRKESVL